MNEASLAREVAHPLSMALDRAPVAAAVSPTSRPALVEDLYGVFSTHRMNLAEVTWHQHALHEWRRWNAVAMVDRVDCGRLTKAEQTYVWNAGRAELTTKPGADRLARLSDEECRRWWPDDPALAAVMQACGTWSRYWNEEEAHHEASFNRLAAMLDLAPIDDATFIRYRKIFPDDNMLRTLVLLAISEIVAATHYTGCARAARDPGLRALFRQVAADEIMHLQYFTSFAQALIRSGRYAPKDALSVAYLFLRDGGELYGSRREHLERRATHVNWWDTLVADDVAYPQTIGKQQKMIFGLIHRVAGIDVSSVAELERTWMEMVGS